MFSYAPRVALRPNVGARWCRWGLAAHGSGHDVDALAQQQMRDSRLPPSAPKLLEAGYEFFPMGVPLSREAQPASPGDCTGWASA